ncbi:immunoglobulin superfamily member 10 [Lissotriton helveticus]
MAMPGSRSRSHLARFIAGSSFLLLLLLLPSPSGACPKPCACYVPTEVHCTFRYLTAIPRHLASNVERINLGYNSLVEITENDFSGQHKMELLMLHSNEIQRINEKAFRDLHSLQVLKMSYNKVRSLHKNTFHGLKSLIRLHMDHNKLEFLNPEALYGLTSLKLVHLEGNLLTQIHADTFVTLRHMQIFKTSSIKHIYLSDNLLSSLPKDMFSYMAELETIYLNGNPWSCDCQMQWFAEWADKSRDMIKCKKDRSYTNGQQCPVCSIPSQNKGKDLSDISVTDLACVKPSIDPALKIKNVTESGESDFSSISAKDFIAPIGTLIINMTDQTGNEANLACNIQRPSDMSPITLERNNGHTLLRTSFSTFLVCNIDYDHIQKLWGILAMYSDSPMKLRRDLLLTKMPYVSYSYKQINSEEDVFTNIEAELRANPSWVMQDQITLQLDRTATTLNTLHVRYSADVQILLEQYEEKPMAYKWAMILKDNTTQTEYIVVTGGTVELDCQVTGEPAPVTEWILPDGSKVRAPYASEEGRIIIIKSGKFILRTVDSFDTGVYHCIGTNYYDADVLTFRIIVVDSDVEHDTLNGPEISPLVGESLHLPCHSTGIPEASVSWVFPDHSVVHQSSSSKHKHIFSNGTLKIQELTQRDRGYFRCIAANPYGFDMLVVKVLTAESENNVKDKRTSLTEEWEHEASGTEAFTDVTEHYIPLTTTHPILRQASRVVSKKQPTSRHSGKSESKIKHKKKGEKPNKRTRGQRRQFYQGNRRIDPQHWAALLEKTKKKPVPSVTKENITTSTKKTNVSTNGNLSGDGEEVSGGDLSPTEEGFIILTTKLPLETTTSKLAVHQMKETQTLQTSKAQTTPSILIEEMSPVVKPMVIELDKTEEQTDKYYSTMIPQTQQSTLQTTKSAPEGYILSQELTTMSSISRAKSLSSITRPPAISNAFSATDDYKNNNDRTSYSHSQVTTNRVSSAFSTVNNLIHVTPKNMHTKLPSTNIVPIVGNTDLTTQKNVPSVVITDHKILTSESQVEGTSTSLPTSQSQPVTSQYLNTTSPRKGVDMALVTVTEPENEMSHIYFQSTQKIITPRLPPGSTIIAHQQIQIIRDVTPNTANSRQRYGRRKISGKRRIVRPDRIPNIKDRYAFLRPERKEVTKESTTVASATELTTKYKYSSSTSSLIEPDPLTTPVTRESTTVKSATEQITRYQHSSSTTSLTRPEPLPTPWTIITTPQTVNVSQLTTVATPFTLFQGKGRTVEPENTGLKSVHTYIQTAHPDILLEFVPTVSMPTYSTNRTSFSSTEYPTTVTGKHATINIFQTTPSQVNREYKNVDLKPTTAKSKISSKTLRGKIPWHRFFGNGQIQKEILKKLRKPKIQTTKSAITTLPATSVFETNTLPVSEIHTSYLSTEAEFSKNDAGLSVSPAIPMTLDNEITLTPTPTFSSTTLRMSPTTISSHITTPITNEINVDSYSPTSTFTTPTTGGIMPSSATTAANTRAVNGARRKWVKRKRPRKKNTTQETITALKSKPSDESKVNKPSQITTNDYTMITSTMTLTSPQVSENATGTPFTSTYKSHPYTASPKPKRRLTTKNKVKPPTGKPRLSTETINMTLPNTSQGIIPKAKKVPIITQETPSYSTTILQTYAPSATAKYQSKTVGIATNKTVNQKIPHETFEYQYTIKSVPTDKYEFVTSTGSPIVTTQKLHPKVQHPTPLSPTISMTPQMAPRQSTLFPSQKRYWNKALPELTEKSKTLTVNTLTILKPPLSLTSDSPVITKNKYSTTFQPLKTENQETTTMNQFTLETSSSDRPTKPKIKGGKLASFTVLANSDAFIPCEATGNPVPTIHWTKVSSGPFLLKSRRGNKLEIFVNGTLSIPNVSIHDRGQYLCVAANQYGSDRLLVTLSVIAYPPRILEGHSKEITVHSGNSVDVKCQAEGRPTPEIVWILPNKSSVSEYSSENPRVSVKPDGTLTISDMTIYDRGLYKCLASNQAGSETLKVKIQVIAAPPIILEDKRQQVEGMLGENLKLPCSARGNPNPSVHWVLFDGTEVKPLQFINSKLFMFSNGTLYIRNLVSADSGNYECIATSSTGSERRVINLIVEQRESGPKIITASPKFTERNFGDQLLLNCSANGEPKPRIIWRLPSKAVVDQWHRMGNRIHVYPNGSLFVEAVTEKDAGDYLCVARNKIGDDLMLMRVSVTMKPAKIDQKQFFKKQVPYGKDFKVDCKASGAPIPEISWSLPDGTMINNVLQADDNGRSRFRRYVLFENGTLFLNKVGITEEGDYTCVAQNTLGKDEMKVHITVVTAAPRIKHNYKTFARARAGEMATFDCEAIGEPRPRTFWLLPSSEKISASNDRYLLHVNGSLSITKVKLLDEGEYMCVARNAAGEDTKLFKLEVTSRPPLINGLYTNKTVIKDTAVKHSRKLIDCRAEGTPPPQVMWIMPDNIFLNAPYYGSRIIVHKNGTLEIRNVRASDTAEFICVARNDGGETVLVVQLEATDMLRRPMFKNPFNEKITARPDTTTVLNCSADGNPPPEMIWLLPNGTRFSSEPTLSRYQIGSDGTFIIYNPTRDDAGKYRCAARNKVGYIEKLIILEVGQKPTILTHPRKAIKVISGEQLSLHCLSDGIPKPNIIWRIPSGLILGRPQINGRYILHENGTLVVRETSTQDHGNYICRAQNNAGDTSIVVPVMIIAFSPRITNRPPQSTQTKSGVAIQLNCVAIGVPKPEVSWEMPDLSILSTASKGRPTGSELLHPQGTLVIQNPRRSDSGTYRCTAKNSHGSDTIATYLQVL